MTVTAVRPLRHACSGCGGCCEGAIVHLLDGEADRVRSQAGDLGVEHPVHEAKLRQVEGRCVFLDPDQRCRIHARFGEDEKPLICRQFPFVLVQTEAGLRAGIDPATHAYASTRHGGPALAPPAGVSPRPAALTLEQAKVEAALVSTLRAPDTTLVALLRQLCGLPPGQALPSGLTDRWLARLRTAPIVPLLNRPEVGPVHREALRPILEHTRTLSAPPPLALTEEDERFTLDLIHDMLWLRLASRLPLVQGTALLLALGAVTCAWAVGPGPRFAVGLSTWCRLLRATPFFMALVPDPGALQQLATGTGPPGVQR